MTAPTCKTCPWFHVAESLCFGPRSDGIDSDVSVGEDAWCHHHPDRQPIQCVECGGKGFQQVEIADVLTARSLCPDCNGRGKHYPRFDEEGKAT